MDLLARRVGVPMKNVCEKVWRFRRPCVLFLFVHAPSPTAVRREEILGEVAEGLHMVFKETQRRAMEAEDNDAFVGLSETAVKLARGVRQCLGWHAKLERERLAAEAGEAEREAQTHIAEVEDRRDAIARKVARRFSETWPDDDDEDDNEVFNERLEALHDRLDDLSGDEDFLAFDPDDLVARLCEEFGVEPPEPQLPLIPGPLTPAQAGEAGTLADSTPSTPPPAPHANGPAPHAPDSS